MNKTLSFETGGGVIELQYKDAGEWFDFEELSLPTDSVIDCNGLWKDEAIFRMKEDWQLRIPTDVLIELINATRKLVNDKDTSWWHSQEELHKRLKGLLK